MSALIDIFGIRLMLHMGGTIPRPVSYEVITALSEAEVTHAVGATDGFRLTFTLARTQRNFSLLEGDALKPDSRVSMSVVLGVAPQTLINGVVEGHELHSGGHDQPDTLTVYGKGVAALLGRKQQNDDHRNQSAYGAVQQILQGRYPLVFAKRDVTQPRSDRQSTEQERIMQQRGKTDLDYIRDLGRHFGFVFATDYIAINVNGAYWGKKYAMGPAQPTLTYNMGGATNLKSLRFSNDPLAPVGVSEGATIDRQMNVVTAPGTPLPPTGMALQPAMPLRTERLGCAARFDLSQINALSEAVQENADAAVSGSGEIDTPRYGHVLRPNRKVVIRGAGLSYNGEFQVTSVTHKLRSGEYSQSFHFMRDGTGSPKG